jgi:hypothetical protein
MATSSSHLARPRFPLALISQAMTLPERSTEDQQIWDELLLRTDQKYHALISKIARGPLPSTFHQFLQQFQSETSSAIYDSYQGNYKNAPAFLIDFFMTIDQLLYVAYYQIQAVQHASTPIPRHDPELATLQTIIGQTSLLERQMREELRAIEMIQERLKEQEKQLPKTLKEIDDEKQQQHDQLYKQYEQISRQSINRMIDLRQHVILDLHPWMHMDLDTLPKDDLRLIIGAQARQIVGAIEEILRDLYRIDIIPIAVGAMYDTTTMLAHANRPTSNSDMLGKVAEVLKDGFWLTSEIGEQQVYQKASVVIYTMR